MNTNNIQKEIKYSINTVKENKIPVIGLITLTALVFTTGYLTGYNTAQDKIPNKTVISNAAYNSLNQGIEELQHNDMEEAQQHIDAGTSFISILYQTGEKQWDNHWFNIELNCFEKQDQEKCLNATKITVQSLKNTYNINKQKD